jgi:hypothetical protein
MRSHNDSIDTTHTPPPLSFYNTFSCFDPNSTCKFFPPNNRVLASPRVLNHVGVTTMGRLDQGHLHPKLEVPRLTCSGRDSNPGLPRPPWWEANTLERSHSNILFNCYSKPLHYFSFFVFIRKMPAKLLNRNSSLLYSGKILNCKVSRKKNDARSSC